MLAIQAKIAQILDGFRRGLAQYEETVSLLGSYLETLPERAHEEFFGTLWMQYRSEPISNLNPKRTVHAVVVRAWSAFGPANSLPARLFSNIDWNDPKQTESWAIVVGGEFVHSLWSYRGRFSKAALDSIKAQCALFLYGESEKLVGTRFAPQLVELAKRLENTVDKINFERSMADLRQTQSRTKEGSKKAVEKSPGQSYDRWEIVSSLTEGGQAHIFVVEDRKKEFPGQWVLKRLKNIRDKARRARFAQEVKATQSIEHPNVLRIVDKNLDAERPYFVAELCQRGSLQKVGVSAYKGNVRAAVDVLLAIADALVAAHRIGVFHRDIKPANILFRGDGTPVVGDFGICFVEGGEPVTLTDEGVGSRNFIAPEMESGQRDLGEPSDRTDVYSLGKVLYWMLSGGLEFARESHRKKNLTDLLGVQALEHVHALLNEMVATNPGSRIGSTDLKERLENMTLLVEGNYAPLAPSIGIQCRFCGIGKYKPVVSKPGYSIPAVGLSLAAGSDVRVLQCGHCGHVEIFQFKGIEDRTWWEK
jgi:tRNA A-37 threonylcarbamoyl transferase component Bud32